MNKFLWGLLCLLFLSGQVSAGQQNADVAQFIQMLASKRKPTIADYRHYYGQGAEDEVAIALKICELKGWKPATSDKKCNNYILNRERNAAHTLSFFLALLRTKIPVSSKLKVSRVKQVRGTGILEYDLIYARMNDKKLVFERTIGSRDYLIQFGMLGLGKIDGVSVHELLVEDLKTINIFERLAGLKRRNGT